MTTRTSSGIGTLDNNLTFPVAVLPKRPDIIPADHHNATCRDELMTWNFNPKAAQKVFLRQGELETLQAKTVVNPETRKTCFLSWENPWGKAGGVYPVADMLPAAMRRAGEDIIVISPYHSGLSTKPPASALHPLGTIGVPFHNAVVECELFDAKDSQGKSWFLFKAPTFFVADGGENKRDPYCYTKGERGDHRQPLLERDSLFAAAAVPHILKHLGRTKDVVCHFQDWQFSGVALTTLEGLLDGTLESAVTVATMHNAYDRYLPEDLLATITLRTHRDLWNTENIGPRDTFLSRFLPLTLGPISAVSQPFKMDLVQDPQQVDHAAPHLQTVFRAHGLVGIGHGPFSNPSELAFSSGALEAAERGDYLPIYREKAEARSRLIDVLRRPPLDAIGRIDVAGQDITRHGDVNFSTPSGTPILVMGGRLEPNQKGFDVLAHAINAIQPGTVKVVFSPLISDDRARVHLDFLAKVARQHPGEVLVLPSGLPREQFISLQKGATYTVWPSLFEPYGAISESYIAGTPAISRATGGLEGQVIDFLAHPNNGTGFTFFESGVKSRQEAARDWKAIHQTLDPAERMKIPLYQALVGALAQELTIAALFYRQRRAEYAHMLANVGRYVGKLSWDDPVGLYRALYDTAGQPKNLPLPKRP